MEDKWLSIDYIEYQETFIKEETEKLFGKDRKGFCDYALDGTNLIIQGVLYLRNIDELNDEKKSNDFKHALRSFSYFHFHRVIYTFKAAYNLLLQGYYTESSMLMRHIVETFVRLRYIAKEENIDFINMAFAGHRGWNGKIFKIKYEKQFNDIAPGLYHYYRILCDISHGAMTSHVLKATVVEDKVEMDTGIVFRPEKSTFVINQFSVYLLAHLEFMMWVFPEIKNKMPERYAEKYHETLTILWRLMKSISKNERNKKWYDAVKQIVRV